MPATLAPPRRPAARPAPPADPPARRPTPAASTPSAVPARPPLPPDDAAVVIPASALTYEGFRAWTRSDDYPAFGRVEMIGGDIFVDLTMERIGSHTGPKTEITRVLANRAVALATGTTYADGIRYALTGAVASFEPDVSFVSDAAFAEGRVERIPTADGEDTIELSGPPDLVVEIVSPSSVSKDTDRLPAECFAGGVREYWLVDCRGEETAFVIHAPGDAGFLTVEPDADGFAASAVLGKSYRLMRSASPVGDWRYSLEER